MNLLNRQQAAELTMFLSRLFAGFLILALATACGPGVSDVVSIHKRLIQKATTDIPCVKEFHEMCPSAQLLPYFEGWRMDSATIQGAEIIHDRYQLTLTIEVKYNPKMNTITSYGAPSITLIEITSVASDDPLHTKHGTNFQISPDQWQKVVQAGGELSAAGIEVKTNDPVSGLGELKAHFRRPPIQ